MAMALAIAPILIAILCGWAARAVELVPKAQWSGVETMTFRLLFPAILISAIGTADPDFVRAGGLGIALIASVAVVGGGVLAARKILATTGIADPSVSTLFQTSTRYNAFVSLAAAELLGGDEVLLLVALTMVLMIPVIQVTNILVLAWLCGGAANPRRIARAVILNPMVIGCVIGLAVNLSPVPPPVPVMQAIEILGRAALGVGLLAVGAGISFRRLFPVRLAVAIGAGLRPLALPAIFLALTSVIGLSDAALLAGILVVAAPTATNGYIIAKAMGGDAELYADVLIWQVFLAMIAIPIYAGLAL